jgi:hypothetical protein
MKLILRTLALCVGGISLSAIGGDPAAAQIHAAFQVANADGNAILDRKEARRFGLAQESLTAADPRDAGQLDEQQFAVAGGQQFAHADHDRDGRLDPKEMQVAGIKSKPAYLAADADGDGTLDRAEFLNALVGQARGVK